MKYILFTTILTTVLFVSCIDSKTKKDFINGKQVPTINSQSSKVNIAGLDSVFKDQEFCAYITQTGTDLQLLSAYIGSHPDNYCDFTKSLVDTSLKQIDNCSIQLKTINDTSYFCLTPTSIRHSNFRLAVLSVDKELNYYLDTLDLSFDVREKTNP